MKFGQYELRELIAVGGMAEVYKGRVVGAEGFEKYVAIKRILPDLSEDDRFVKMLLTEARIHSTLSHRNIVQIHDLGISEDGEYFIVLEYVEGYDLRMITAQLGEHGEIIPEALSLYIAAEVAHGLQFAHEMHGADGQPLAMVHRDVSPSNVLISLAGEVKLSDFGLAKRRHDRSVVGSLKGNLAYMSPEQARQVPLDRRTDVFSLGAVLFELLTGQRLREITDEIAGWNQVASGVVPSIRSVRPELPESFERLLSRALAAEPQQRFPDAAAFGAAIRAVLAEMNTPVGASDLQTLLSTLSPPRRPRALLEERSKVIRLGPEAQALGEAIAGPTTPPPVPIATLAPGMTPQAPRRAPGGVSVPPRFAAPVDEEFPLTPAPERPLPAVESWRASPRGPVPLTRADRPTPPRPVTVARPDPPRARLHSPASASAVPTGGAGWGGGSAAALALAEPARAPSRPAFPVASPRHRRETVRLAVRGSGGWRRLLLAGAIALVVIAAGVHAAVVPLDVLFVWRAPATVSVDSEPGGASVQLDAATLPGVTPLQLAVRRDRFDHVLQVRAAGYKPVRETIRYDGSVRLSFTVRLEKAAPPAFEALPPAAPAAASPIAVPSEPAPRARAALAPAKPRVKSAKATRPAVHAKAGARTKTPHARPAPKRR